MPTIKDVAQHAGVSITTVSHVLNNTRFVSPDLRARVAEAIATLGYQPNTLARSLRSKETHTLGMIVPDISNPFFAEIARSIEDAAFGFGYNIILCNSDEDPEKEQAYIELLLEKQVDGIVFVASGSQSKHLRLILDREIPTVVVDRSLDESRLDCVLVDNRGGGFQATQHLLASGRRRIGCISGPSSLTPSWERVEGYREALASAGLHADDTLIRRGDFHADRGFGAMIELLDLPEPPTAVFVCNDLMAIGAIRAITERGLRVPEDIAVVGFDNIALARYTQPPLTTVAQPYVEMGRLAAELLVKRVNGITEPPRQFLLETTLVIRQTS